MSLLDKFIKKIKLPPPPRIGQNIRDQLNKIGDDRQKRIETRHETKRHRIDAKSDRGSYRQDNKTLRSEFKNEALGIAYEHGINPNESKYQMYGQLADMGKSIAATVGAFAAPGSGALLGSLTNGGGVTLPDFTNLLPPPPRPMEEPYKPPGQEHESTKGGASDGFDIGKYWWLSIPLLLLVLFGKKLFK